MALNSSTAELLFLLKAQNDASPVFKQAKDDLEAVGVATGKLADSSKTLVDNNQQISAGFAGTGASILDFKAKTKEASEAAQIHSQFVKEQAVAAKVATDAVNAHTEAVKKNSDAQKNLNNEAAKNTSSTPPIIPPSRPPRRTLSDEEFAAANAAFSDGLKTRPGAAQLDAAKAAAAAGLSAPGFNPKPPKPPGDDESEEAAKHLKHAHEEAIGLREAIEEVGKAFVAAFVSNEIVRETVGAFAKAQEELLRLKQAADLSAEAIREINEQSEKLSTTTVNLGSGEINQIATIAARVGVEGTEKINEFAKSISEMAAITGTSGPAAAQSIGKILIATNETQEGVKEFTNALSALGPKSLEGTQGLLSTTAALAQQTQGFKFAATELLGLAAAVDKVTKRPELFARQLPELLTQLQSGAEKDTQAFQFLAQQAGLTAEAFSDMVQNSPNQALLQVLETVKSFGGDNNQVKAFLRDIGITGPQAVSTITALANNIPTLKASLQQAADAAKDTTAQQQRLKEAMALIGPQATLAKNAMEALGEAIGEAAAPTALAGLKLIAEAAKGVKEAFTALPPAVQESIAVTIAFGGTATALGLAFNAVKTLGGAAFGSFIPLIQTATKLTKDLVIAQEAAAAATAASTASSVVAAEAGAVAAATQVTRWTGAAVAINQAGVASRIALAALGGFATTPAGAAILGIAVAAGTIYLEFDKLKDLLSVFRFNTEISDEATKIYEKAKAAREEYEKLTKAREEAEAKAANKNDEKSEGGIKPLNDFLRSLDEAGARLGKAITGAVAPNSDSAAQYNALVEADEKRKLLAEGIAKSTEEHVEGMKKAHEAAEREERAVDNIRRYLDEADRQLLNQVSRYSSAAEEVKKLQEALNREKELPQGNPFQLGGKDASPELRRELEAQSQGQINEKAKALDPIYETVKALKEQLASEQALTKEQKNQVEIAQTLERERVRIGALSVEKAQELAKALRDVQEAQKNAAFANEVFSLTQAVNVAKELTQTGRERAEIENKITEYKRANSGLDEKAEASLRRILTLQQQLANFQSLQSKLDPTAAASRDYADELQRIDQLKAAGIIKDQQTYDLFRRRAELLSRDARDPLGAELVNMQREIDLLSVEPSKLESVRAAREKILQLQRQGVDLTKEQQDALEKSLTTYNEEVKKAQELNQSGFKGFAAGIKNADQQFADLQKSFAEGLSSSIAQALSEGFNGRNAKQIFLNFLKQFDAQVLKATIDGLFKKAIESDAGKGFLGGLFGDPAKPHADAAKTAGEQIEAVRKEINEKLDQRIFNAQQATINVTNAVINGLAGALADKGLNPDGSAANDNRSGVGPFAFSRTNKSLPAEAGGSTNQGGAFSPFGFSSLNAGELSGSASKAIPVQLTDDSQKAFINGFSSFLSSRGISDPGVQKAFIGATAGAESRFGAASQQLGDFRNGSPTAFGAFQFREERIPSGLPEAIKNGDITKANTLALQQFAKEFDANKNGVADSLRQAQAARSPAKAVDAAFDYEQPQDQSQRARNTRLSIGNRINDSDLQVQEARRAQAALKDVEAQGGEERTAVARKAMETRKQAENDGNEGEAASVRSLYSARAAAAQDAGAGEVSVIQASEQAKAAAYQTSASAALEVENAHQSLSTTISQAGTSAQSAAPEFTAAGNALRDAGSAASSAQGGGSGSSSSSGGLTGFASSIGQLTSQVGRAIPGVGGLVSQIGNLISQSAKLLSSGGSGGGGGGIGDIVGKIFGGIAGGGGGGGGGWSTGALNSIGAVNAGSVGGTSMWFYHDGAENVGISMPSFTRNVNPAVFSGAPKFHDGLMSDEFPAILQRGEQVISKARKREMEEHTNAINDNLALSERLVANAQSGGMMAAGLSRNAASNVGPASGQQVHQYHMPITIVAPNPDSYRQALPQIATQTKMAMDRAHRRNA